MSFRIQRHADPAAFRARAEPWLLAAEAEYNLLLGIIGDLVRGRHAFESPIYLATIEGPDGVAGCAFRTPPYRFGLTRLPREVLPALIDDATQIYDTLPGVLGPEQESTAFAELWTERFGGSWKVTMRLRIHVLEKVKDPDRPARGRLRETCDDDLELVRDWADRFVNETEVSGPSAAGLADRLHRSRSLFVWEDGEPRCMAAAMGATAHGIRVGYVYTPEDCRGRGYASTLVAELSRLLLGRGLRFCSLYTDLANPTSNAIYQRVGYDPVSDVVDIRFD